MNGTIPIVDPHVPFWDRRKPEIPSKMKSSNSGRSNYIAPCLNGHCSLKPEWPVNSEAGCRGSKAGMPRLLLRRDKYCKAGMEQRRCASASQHGHHKMQYWPANCGGPAATVLVRMRRCIHSNSGHLPLPSSNCCLRARSSGWAWLPSFLYWPIGGIDSQTPDGILIK